MKPFKLHIIFFSLSLIALVVGCVEPFEAKTASFENALVINALLTTEQKLHTVKLSRAFRFEEENSIAETSAQVVISDDIGTLYQFNETEPGLYTSTTVFGATQGRTYRLNIALADGRSYNSERIICPENTPIIDLKAQRELNDFGEEGVSIRLDNSSNESSYFRFEYEETYKVIAPKYDPFEFEVIDYIACDGNFYEVGLKQRVQDLSICYGSAVSTELIQASTVNLEANKVENFKIRFIGRDNYIMTHRYSLLVKQFTQTQDAYSYYQQLGNFSSSENIFSQIQPGFLYGNIKSETDQDEKVLGYFEVASVNERRVYFNYADLFPDEDLPPFPVNCETVSNPQLITRGYHCDGMGNCDGSCESPLIEGILAGIIVFAAVNENVTADTPGPYLTLPSPCGDCSKLGSNIVPDFWEE